MGEVLVVVSPRPLDDLPHPAAHPEQVGVEAVLPVPVASLAPGHDADLVPAVLCRVLQRDRRVIRNLVPSGRTV